MRVESTEPAAAAKGDENTLVELLSSSQICRGDAQDISSAYSLFSCMKAVNPSAGAISYQGPAEHCEYQTRRRWLACAAKEWTGSAVLNGGHRTAP